MKEAPDSFGAEFLNWFRARTEQDWAKLPNRSSADFLASSVTGSFIKKDTKWKSGLMLSQIEMCEKTEGVRYPPDLRLLLENLNGFDRPRWSVGYEGNKRVVSDRPGFFDRVQDQGEIAHALADLSESLEWDVINNAAWQEGWGPAPIKPESQIKVLRERLSRAPKLLPLYGQRFLLAEPCKAGNPVLSIVGTDVILYGFDLRDYLLRDFGLISSTGALELPVPEIPFWTEWD